MFLPALAPIAAGAVRVPAGTNLFLRLTTPVSSHMKEHTPIEAVLLAAVTDGDAEVIPVGSVVRGSIAHVGHSDSPHHAATLRLAFDEIAGPGVPPVRIKSKVVEVDNARESIGEDGTIYGLQPLRGRPRLVEELLLLAAHAHPLALAATEGSTILYGRFHRPQVVYRAGVDLRIVLEEPLELAASLPAPPGRRSAARLEPSPALDALVRSLPLRTVAAKPPSPSDITNIVILGGEAALRRAFEDAGWSTADPASVRADTETFFAIAAAHSFREAPVSALLLAGRKPNLVFEKQTNTFAKRHHVRIWRQEVTFNRLPVWVGAGTHDIAIVFSREARTFTHKVERDVDLERDKIVNDLCFTGLVAAKALVERPSFPHDFENATGDRLRTDGAIAVLELANE